MAGQLRSGSLVNFTGICRKKYTIAGGGLVEVPPAPKKANGKKNGKGKAA
jgi:hypothetical protein